jgi:opacity protein-like surface antigen
MRVFSRIGLAAALMTMSTAAGFAADIIEEPPVIEPEVIVAAGGWYLRGDLGMSNQQLHGGLSNELFDTVDTLEFLDEGHFSSAPTFQVGVGYQWNEWMRFDATAQYRGKSEFSALDRYEVVDDGDPTTWDGANDYSAKKSEWLLLANAYVDLGTFSGITPYVGGGLGMSRNTISDFRDVNTPNNGVAYGNGHSQWEFAWALHTGVAMDVTERMSFDLGYSYINMGDAASDDVVAFDGTNNVKNPMKFEEITSHDLKFGLRYKLN